MNYLNKEECIKDFNENYRNPSHPIAFSGVNNIYKYYKGILKVSDIERLLASVESYTLRREYKNLRRNPSYTHFKRYQFQADLIDIQKLNNWNDNVRYLFAVIDTFTRKAWVRPCIDKTADSILIAFKSILNETGRNPVTLVTDRGSELKNNKFILFCKKSNIKFSHNFTSVHAAYIERFNRTFQNLIYKFLSQFETRRYIDNLQDFVNSYNNREHRMIGMSPQAAELEENHEKVSLMMNKYHETIKKEKPKYQINQLVRIALQKGVFHRGYNEQSNFEVFNIYNVKNTLPKPLYLLETYDKKDKIIGGFYAHEIMPVNSDIFKVEKVIKQKNLRGKLQYFVKWKGYDNTHNSWINAEDITEVFNN
jgi:transposase InsO family protein